VSTATATATATAAAGSVSTWVRFRAPVPSPRLRLLCFPHAGGGASAYRAWPGLMPEGVEACPVQLPARESRMGDPLPATLDELVREAADALMPLLDVPFALVGTSFGSLLAYELAHRLRGAHGFGPSALVVSSEWAPSEHHRESATSASASSDEAFLAELRRGQVLPASVLDDPDLLALALPPLRGDSALSAAYRHRRREPLDCPVWAFHGAHDPRVSTADMEPWDEETTAGFRLHEVDSAHLVLDASEAEVVPALVADLLAEGLLG
jgi:medium-chain acyl-[acyl-carrier-protein] hydrolase